MRIVAISDTHNLHRQITMPPGDVLVVAGDFTMNGTIPECIEFLSWIRELDYPHKLFIAGNHDLMFDKQRDMVPAAMALLPNNCVYMQDDEVEIAGMKFYGLPWVRLGTKWAFSYPSSKALRTRWEQIPDDANVVISHMPPHGVRDIISESMGEGCQAIEKPVHLGASGLLRAIQRVKPAAHIFGHVHPGHGKEEREGTIFANVAQCGDDYRIAHRPIILDL